MAEVHGTELDVTFDGVAIEGYLMDDVEFSGGDREKHDKTAYGATADAHFLASVKKNIPITIGGVMSTEFWTAMAAKFDTTATLTILPRGNASGRPRLTGTASLHDLRWKSGGPMGKQTWTATLSPSGNFPIDTVP